MNKSRIALLVLLAFLGLVGTLLTNTHSSFAQDATPTPTPVPEGQVLSACDRFRAAQGNRT